MTMIRSIKNMQTNDVTSENGGGIKFGWLGSSRWWKGRTWSWRRGASHCQEWGSMLVGGATHHPSSWWNLNVNWGWKKFCCSLLPVVKKYSILVPSPNWSGSHTSANTQMTKTSDVKAPDLHNYLITWVLKQSIPVHLCLKCNNVLLQHSFRIECLKA